MPTITLEPHLKLHYIDENPAGQSTILLLHGLGADGSSWGLQIPGLAEAGFRVLAPDARGFGQSPYPGGQHTVAQMAQDMARLLTELRVGPAHVVGISMGGVLALQLALDHPNQVHKLVLVNTFASLRPKSLKVWAYFLYRFLLVHIIGLSAQARAVSWRIFPRPEQEELRRILYTQIMQADVHGYRTTMRALALFNVKERLHEIKMPTLVVTGENDTTVPPDNQAALALGIPNARHTIVPGAGHAITAEQPQVFNQILLKFLLPDKADSF